MIRANASIKALRALMRSNFESQQEFDRHFSQMTSRNDRLVAVVGGAMTETALQRRITSVVHGESEETLFGPQKVLSSFSSKIAVAYAFKLIDDDTRRNANYIREIRNVFAHRVMPTSFSTPEVKAVCKLLLLGSRSKSKLVRSPRTRFLFAVVATGLAIWGRGPLDPVANEAYQLQQLSLQEKRRKQPS